MRKDTTYERKVDSLGRFVLPKEVSAELGIEPGDSLCVWLDKDSQEVVLKKTSLQTSSSPDAEL